MATTLNRTAPGRPPQSTAPAAVAVLGGARFLTSREVMPLLGYSNLSNFWVAVKVSGVPFIRINRRRCVFEEHVLRAWLDSRAVGGVRRERCA